jgi:RNA polymerase sigma-70 factor (ECF subfamily)
VFHDVWRRASTYDADSGTVLAWIMNQARSRAIDRLRFENRKKRVDPHGAIRHHEADRGVLADGADAAERALRLREALSTLSADERRAVETAFFSGLTYSETATRLDQPLGTVKTRIRSAFVKLKKALDGGGGER